MTKYFKLAVLLFLIMLAGAGVLLIRYFNAAKQQAKKENQSVIATSSAVWGVYTGQSDVSDFEKLIGQKMKLVAIFVGFDELFPAQIAQDFGIQNKTVIIFWEPSATSLDNIKNGNSDAYIKQFAASAKIYGGPIILVPFPEMNGDWDPWGGTIGNNSPTKIIEAWQRIHNLFDAPNVKFGWAINHESVPDIPTNQIEKYYPGDAYVDYVGADGFNFGDPWQSFAEIFKEMLSKLSVYKKPIYLFSFASAPGPKKADWIADALLVQIPKNPQIAGWVWFNEQKEKDWRVTSDQRSLDVFKSALKSIY